MELQNAEDGFCFQAGRQLAPSLWKLTNEPRVPRACALRLRHDHFKSNPDLISLLAGQFAEHILVFTVEFHSTELNSKEG